MVTTLQDMSNFSLLMLIFIFTYTLLGLEIFSFKAKFKDEYLSEPYKKDEDVEGKEVFYPRTNFNTFLSGFTTVFVVLIGEDWNGVMYDHMRTIGGPSKVFFFTLFVQGNLILLNLFLAILLKNFEDDIDGGAALEEVGDDDHSHDCT